jgi:hypothetical protein
MDVAQLLALLEDQPADAKVYVLRDEVEGAVRVAEANSVVAFPYNGAPGIALAVDEAWAGG